MKTPITLIIDDPAPVLSVYYEHISDHKTKDGRPLVQAYDNRLLHSFCDVVERHGIRGKFSIVPMPVNKGDLLQGLEGVSDADLTEWLDTVKRRVVPQFSVGPEILTHHKAVNLTDGSALPMNEYEWSKTQTEATLTPYLAQAIRLLQKAGFSPEGVTSPWNFGMAVEEDYVRAISRAVYESTGGTTAWYFLHSIHDRPNARPWTALREDGRTVVSIPATVRDYLWRTIDSPDESEEFVCALADKLITEDGKEGEILRVLESGGYPAILAHWQCLMSNGLGTGIRVLDTVAERIGRHLSDRVEWTDFSTIARTVAADPAAYPKPRL